MGCQTARDWAVEEFGGAVLCDTRWRTRLVAVAAQAARRPGGTVAEVFNEPAARQGAYGLLECAGVRHEEMRAAMFAAGASRCQDLAFVYVPVDGSSLKLVDNHRTKGFGCVGDHAHGARGLKTMTALLVSPQGVPLGVGGQSLWERHKDAARRSRQRRRPQDKETQQWLSVMEQTRAAMASAAPTTRVWFQLDREGDAWPILMDADYNGSWFTIRSSHNRRVRLPDGSMTYLRAQISAQPVVGTYALQVSAGKGRSARLAAMATRACTVTLDFKDLRTKKHFPKTVNVVWAHETTTTPAGEKPISWLLLTNRPITTCEELMQVVAGYAQRWRIEEFHRAWKSGACDVERMQLRSAEAAKKWATILAAVSVRIERLKKMSREQPDTPASEEFSAVELRAIVLLRFGDKASAKVPSGTVITMKQAVQWTAEIGGYTGGATGKSSGGPPGTVTISRGLNDVLAVARVLTAMESTCG